MGTVNGRAASQFNDQKRVGERNEKRLRNPLAQLAVDGESPAKSRTSPNERGEEREQQALDRLERPIEPQVGGVRAKRLRKFARSPCK
jgi:hypothetical protein